LLLLQRERGVADTVKMLGYKEEEATPRHTD
jgi:hypothetical protein